MSEARPPVTDQRGSARWLGYNNLVTLQQAAYQRVMASAARAIELRGQFLCVLAGGSTPRGTYHLLRQTAADWSRWQVYFGDERCLPAADAERNSRMAAEAWLDHVSIPAGNIHWIEAELGPEVAAERYTRTLRGVNTFDLVLLGLGEDGHVASLFPGQPWGDESEAPDVLPVFNAPKPPPERVSLSAARLSRTRELLFLVAGESKRAALSRWRAGELIPATAVHTRAGGADVLVEASLLRPLAGS